MFQKYLDNNFIVSGVAGLLWCSFYWYTLKNLENRKLWRTTKIVSISKCNCFAVIYKTGKITVSLPLVVEKCK